MKVSDIFYEAHLSCIYAEIRSSTSGRDMHKSDNSHG